MKTDKNLFCINSEKNALSFLCTPSDLRLAKGGRVSRAVVTACARVSVRVNGASQLHLGTATSIPATAGEVAARMTV